MSGIVTPAKATRKIVTLAKAGVHAALFSIFALAACVSARPPAPRTTVAFAPPSGASSEMVVQPSANTPHLSEFPTAVAADASAVRPYAPRMDLDYQNVDLREAVSELAQKNGVGVSLDSSVHGPVTVHAKAVTFDEALALLLANRGFQAVQSGATLVVAPKRLETRIFTLSYPAMTRIASGNTSVARQFQSSNSSGSSQTSSGVSGLSGSSGGNLAGGSGGDVIQGYSDADIWNEVRVSLETMLFPPVAGLAGAAQAAPATQQGSGAGTPPTGRCAIDGTCLSITPVGGIIQITASADRLDRVSTWLKAYESSIQRQVLIEAKIVEVDLTKSSQYGINWSAVASTAKGLVGVSSNPAGVPAAGTTTCPSAVCFQFAGGSVTINAVLAALESQGKVDVLSDPQVLALNNQRASLNVTTDENFFATTQVPVTGSTGVISYNTQVQIQQIAVGIVLDVTPQIAADNTMMMNIRPLVTSLDHTDTFTSGGASATAPVTSRREADTMARLRAGETVVIGGLTQTKTDVEKTGIPGLMRLPGIGKWFTSYTNTQTRSELVIFLTPTIISGQPPA